MRVSRQLNLVVPVETELGVVHVHATPIDNDTFERYHLVIAKTFSAMTSQNVAALGGPRVAMMMLRDAAASLGEEMVADVEAGLIAEIRRLSNVAVPDGSSWKMITLYDAVKDGLLDEKDASEVDNILAFFTVNSAMHRRKVLPIVLGIASSLWDAQISSLEFTEFLASLKTSTPVVPTTEKAPASSIPH